MDNDWLWALSPLKFFLNGTCSGANFCNGRFEAFGSHAEFF